MSGAEDLSRFARQLVLPEISEHGQRLLMQSRVAIVGCGGLGCAASTYLAGAGIGHLQLVDGDRVEISNLPRQPLFSEAELGEYKANAAAGQLQRQFPGLTVSACPERADADHLAQLAADHDIVLDCSDNFPTRFAINRACVAACKPLVSGAAIRFEGQVVSFHAGHGDSACYRCLYAEPGESAERCEEAGILAPVVGIIGSLQASDAIAILLRIGPPRWGRLRVYDARRLEWKTLQVPRDPACPDCGERS